MICFTKKEYQKQKANQKIPRDDTFVLNKSYTNGLSRSLFDKCGQVLIHIVLVSKLCNLKQHTQKPGAEL